MMKNMTCKGETMNSNLIFSPKERKECWAELFPNSGSTTAKPADSAEAKKEAFKKYKENAMVSQQPP